MRSQPLSKAIHIALPKGNAFPGMIASNSDDGSANAGDILTEFLIILIDMKNECQLVKAIRVATIPKKSISSPRRSRSGWYPRLRAIVDSECWSKRAI